MKRCTRCVMPESVPGITFDENGVCNFCRDYKNFNVFGIKQLEKITNRGKYINSDFDCVVPLSGGRDSTYVLYFAKEVLGLKVLAVNYDNEFRNKQAIKNMENACKILSVDFISIRSKYNICRKLVINNIRSRLKDGLYGIIRFLCMGCTYGYRSVVYKTAINQKIPIILWGESNSEQTQSLEEKAFRHLGLKMHRRFYDLYDYKSRLYQILQRFEFNVMGNNPLSNKPVFLKNDQIKSIKMFDYIFWDRRKIKNILEEKLDWEKPLGSISSWRTDCLLHPFVNYCFIKLLYCSKDCFGYCNMINSGEMTRSKALLQETANLNIDKGYIWDLLTNKIGLKKNEAELVIGS